MTQRLGGTKFALREQFRFAILNQCGLKLNDDRCATDGIKNLFKLLLKKYKNEIAIRYACLH